jgi:hypothetical protein
VSCIKPTKKKKIVFKENRRSAIFENAAGKQFSEALVDGCLITDKRERCDFFLRSDDTIWLIELKGRDVEKAVSQIVSTSKHLNAEVDGREIVPVIVATSCPAISGQQKCMKRLSGLQGKFSGKIVLRTRIAKICV